MSDKKYALTVFSLTMITVGSVDSIRNLPATALFGSQLISFFIMGALFFLSLPLWCLLNLLRAGLSRAASIFG